MSTGYFVGPIPHVWFFRHFMKGADGSMPAPRSEFRAVADARDVDTMRLKLVATIERYGLAPGLEYVVTEDIRHDEPVAGPSTANETEENEHSRPSIYARPRRQGSASPRSTPDILPAPIDFSDACLPVYVNPEKSSDPLLDPLDFTEDMRTTIGPYKFAWYDDDKSATRDILAAQARELMYRQHRVFLYQLVLCNRYARFVRWDRNGAVATERFDYTNKPSVLAEFLWRFAHLNRVQRGWDHTVSLANQGEEKLFKTAMQRFLKAQTGGKSGKPVRRIPRADLTLDEGFPTWKIRVEDEHTNESTCLVIKRPFHSTGGVLGRSTRAYLAYDLKSKRLVFFKDAWRAAYSRILGAESHTYRILQKHNVPHLPTILYACDVMDYTGEIQKTKSYGVAIMNRAWDQRKKRHGESIHHRIVQDIAYPLQQALDEREFIQALHDAALVMGTTHARAGLIHRDLSANNIMITSDGRGILNDWDMAGPDAGSIYVGTWKYMSIDLLQNPETKRHDILDDFESLYWILQHGRITRYSEEGADQPLEAFDEMVRDEDRGQWIGGTKKLELVLKSEGAHIPCPCEPLRQLVVDMDSAWRHYHELRANREKEAEWKETRALYKRASFWTSIFASALKKFPAKAKRGRGRKTEADAPTTRASTKRKAEPEPSDEPVRRSKRLKAKRGEI